MTEETGTEQPGATTDPVDATGATPTHEDRLRQGGDYAVEQFKKVQGESTKLYQKVKALEPVAKIADQLGGADAAARFIYEYDGVLKHPEVARVVAHYRANGVLPTTSSMADETPTDEHEDPQTKRIKDLEAQLARVSAEVSQTRGHVGKQTVMGYFNKLQEKYPDEFEPYIKPAIETQMAEWEKSQHGRELMNSLTIDHLETLAAKAMLPHLGEIGEKRFQRTLESKKSAATGVGAPVRSNGREPGASTTHSTGYEAWQEYKRINGLR